MGDRANIVLKSSNNPADIVLYTHWDGYRTEALLAEGIRAAQRAGRATGDESYGFRAVVQTFFDAIGPADGLGAGISTGSPYEAAVTWNYDAGTVTDFDDVTRPVAEFLALHTSVPA